MTEDPLYNEKSLNFQVCICLIIVFALVLACGVSGIFYGFNKDSHGYIWAGGICVFIALGVEGLASYCLYKGKR